ncbi:MAG: cation diffusion facilitator family transporter [Bifidobacteriaceae bacterium]|jgi:cobalt-zinc-cadmium efflux system protein|nr:cation diffusion facilitator family transporter [Bifidobacteriaceae bacterium]
MDSPNNLPPAGPSATASDNQNDHTNLAGNNQKRSAISIALILNSAFTVFEVVIGLISGSLALVADAIHNATDVLTLSISFVANKISRRQGNKKHTFGYGRATILAAQFNSMIMILVAGFIAFEAYQRLWQTLEIEGMWVIVVAACGIVVNGIMAWLLSKEKSDLNMRSAYIDLFFDTLSSGGAVISGIVLVTSGYTKVDSIIAFVIAALLLFNALQIFKEAVSILLEGTPKEIDLQKVERAILADPRILITDDILVWSIRSHYNFLACHIVIDDRDFKHARDIVNGVKDRLVQIKIQHTTIEVENHADHLRFSHEH